MCVICVSKRNRRQPTKDELRSMFYANPHGAGYMYSDGRTVQIRKGFQSCTEFIQAVEKEHFSSKDPVVYHFRISTQAGRGPEMTHPFPLSANGKKLQALRTSASVGIAHNGIIPLTSDPKEKTYSDTALFIQRYLTKLIRNTEDFYSPYLDKAIEQLAESKFALLNKHGDIRTVGSFIEDDGLLFSNGSYRQFTSRNVKASYAEALWDL